MNAREIIEQAFSDASEPPDFSPYTTPGDPATFSLASPGGQKLLRMLNNGVLRISNWKFRSGRLLRLRSLISSIFMAVPDPIEGTVISATASGVVVPLLGADIDHEFDGWLISIVGGTGVGQTALVTNSAVVPATGVNLTVHTPWTTTPDATSLFELRKRFMQLHDGSSANTIWNYHMVLDPIRVLSDVLQIRKVDQQSALSRIMPNEDMSSGMLTVGSPSSFAVRGNRIEFDVVPEEGGMYEIIYTRKPILFTQADAEVTPDIPSEFHDAVSLWITHNLLRNSQDFDGAYATKRELEDLMEMTRLPESFENDMDYLGITLWG